MFAIKQHIPIFFEASFTSVQKCFAEKKKHFKGQYKKPHTEVGKPWDVLITTSVTLRVSPKSAVCRAPLKTTSLLNRDALLGRNVLWAA